MSTYISTLSCYLPETIVTNEQLHVENPGWDMERIAKKTGIYKRHIAAPGQTASDLAFIAAERLFVAAGIPPAEVDYLLFCTQSPDYFLPASACVLHDRLHLPVNCGAIDFNQGCSGYVYGLQLANALVASGTAHNILFLTGETYSKYIHPQDRSARVLFGDAGTATLISGKAKGARILGSVVGTDGSGWSNLIVPMGASRHPCGGIQPVDAEDDNGNIRNHGNLYMQGQELFTFTLKRVPAIVKQVLEKTGLTESSIDAYVFHQANAFMNEHLRKKMLLPQEKVPVCFHDVGNTVSNTIPLALSRIGAGLSVDNKVMLIGFGVGYSWGSCIVEWGDVTFAPSPWL